MSYKEIDSVIRDWVLEKKLQIYTSYKDCEVRSIEIVDVQGRRYQIWIDKPDAVGLIGIHAWDYKKNKKDFLVDPFGLLKGLNQSYDTVIAWSNKKK